jgi:hypothetical protein
MSGSAARALATPTRCCWPPKARRGIGSVNSGFQLHEAQKFVDAGIDFLFVPLQHAGNDGDVARDGLVGKKADLLDHIPHAEPKPWAFIS